MSWIQKAALLYLVRHETATIKAMKPPDVDANLFSYHLEKLRVDGYVTKAGRGTYGLTPKGHRLVSAFSTATDSASEFMKTVVMLYAKTDDSKYLLFTWSRQPYFGKTGFVQDHVAAGKSLADGLTDACRDKLGAVVPLTYMVSALIKVMHGGELVSHMNVLVYKAAIDTISFPYISRNGTAFLSELKDAPGKMTGLDELIAGVEIAREPQEFILSY